MTSAIWAAWSLRFPNLTPPSVHSNGSMEDAPYFTRYPFPDSTLPRFSWFLSLLGDAVLSVSFVPSPFRRPRRPAAGRLTPLMYGICSALGPEAPWRPRRVQCGGKVTKGRHKERCLGIIWEHGMAARAEVH